MERKLLRAKDLTQTSQLQTARPTAIWHAQSEQWGCACACGGCRTSATCHWTHFTSRLMFDRKRRDGLVTHFVSSNMIFLIADALQPTTSIVYNFPISFFILKNLLLTNSSHDPLGHVSHVIWHTYLADLMPPFDDLVLLKILAFFWGDYLAR